MDTIPRLFEEISTRYPDETAQLIKDENAAFHARTWRELRSEVDRIAAGLRSLGVARGDHVGLISENRGEWFACDLAVLSLGAADVPRGNDATADELAYILSFSEAWCTIVENITQLEKIGTVIDRVPSLTTLIVIEGEIPSPIPPSFTNKKVLSYKELGQYGDRYLEENDASVISSERAAGTGDDVATLIFTSGTTGVPKGVMLSHRNFLHQVENVPTLIDVGPDDIWLCVLPVWHSFERIMQYVALGRGSALAYSKPIGKVMLEDFQKVRPTWMASVPRIWEAIRAGIYRNIKKESAVKRALFSFFVTVGGTYSHLQDMFLGRLPRFTKRNRAVDAAIAIIPLVLLFPFKKLGDLLVFGKIKARLGGRFSAGISGGGALPEAVDKFFSAAGILLLEGYGLTETAPVLGVRAQRHPVPGTVGPVFPGTEVEIRDENGTVLPPGSQGIVFARGPQVMLGYYKQPEMTAEILSDDGWINTGDLGMLTWDNELKITGRAKDTIVLLGGENVEPAPIEERLRESEYISHVMIVGQDQKYLGALIVPEFDALERWAVEAGISDTVRASLVANADVRALFSEEIGGLVNQQAGFKSFEQVYRFALLDDEFTVGDVLSAKQEIKRHVIVERYEKEISDLFT
jgi:long-chain acyl-CoA synthetase